MIYVYGPNDTPIEQINNSSGTVQYLHHDQAGSTRLITGSTGKTEATFTYGPYGELTGSTGTATTPLDYDGQYTSSDTGLVYLRNRVYDPTTAQFLTVDPAVALTREPYAYGDDNPEDDFRSILDEVELHYGIASAERPAVTVLRVLGAATSDSVREALRVQGFTAIESRPDGLLARWHRE